MDQNSKVGHAILTTPLSGTVCDTYRPGHAMIGQPTKFEVPNFTRYGYMKVVTKCRKWGGLGWSGVIQDH